MIRFKSFISAGSLRIGETMVEVAVASLASMLEVHIIFLTLYIRFLHYHCYGFSLHRVSVS